MSTTTRAPNPAGLAPGLYLAEVVQTDGDLVYEVRRTYTFGGTDRLDSFGDLLSAWNYCAENHPYEPAHLVRELAEIDLIDALMEQMRDGRLSPVPAPWLANHSTGELLITRGAHEALFPDGMAAPAVLARQHRLADRVAFELATHPRDGTDLLMGYPFPDVAASVHLTIVGEFVVIGLERWTP